VAILLALFSSLLMSGTTIIMKKGIERTNPTSAMLVVTLAGTLILLVITLPLVQFDHLNSKAFLLFALAGLFSPALVRWLYFISLDRIGPSMSSSIISTGPAFTAIIASVFLKEKLTVAVGLGIILIIGGIIIFGRDINSTGKFAVGDKQNLIFALSAAVLAGLAIVIRKMGLNVLDEPLFGVTVGFTTSLVFYALMCLAFKGMRAAISLNRKNTLYLCGAGAFLTAGWLTLFYALSYGDAIIVAPLASLHPAMVLGWSHLFFKDMEKITFKTVLGMIIVLIGVLLIALRH
jgi:DME family drug/metabolite transporter